MKVELGPCSATLEYLRRVDDDSLGGLDMQVADGVSSEDGSAARSAEYKRDVDGRRRVGIDEDRDGDRRGGRSGRERDGGVDGRVVHSSTTARVVGRERHRERLGQVAAAREGDRGRSGGLGDVILGGRRAARG